MIEALEHRWAHIASVPCGNTFLIGHEQDDYLRLKQAHRRTEWLAGRWIAKEWIAEKLGGPARVDQIAILSRDGLGRGAAPKVIWNGRILPWRLSISHASDLVLVSLAELPRMSVGADLVAIEDFATSNVEIWFTRVERAWVNRSARDAQSRRRAAVWALKEAGYKALNRGEPFRPVEWPVFEIADGIWSVSNSGKCCRACLIDLGHCLGAIAASCEAR